VRELSSDVKLEHVVCYSCMHLHVSSETILIRYDTNRNSIRNMNINKKHVTIFLQNQDTKTYVLWRLNGLLRAWRHGSPASTIFCETLAHSRGWATYPM